jgi:hypothetical protein
MREHSGDWCWGNIASGRDKGQRVTRTTSDAFDYDDDRDYDNDETSSGVRLWHGRSGWMSESTTIAAMLKSVVDGPAWHGPSVMELVETLGAEQARRKGVKDAHSIWELLLHMTAWQEYALEVLKGKDAAPLEGAADWPALPEPPRVDEWETTKRKFEGGMRELRERIIHLDDTQLRETVPGRNFPIKVLLHGLVHHNLYHAGQIALLRKAIGISAAAKD